MLPTGISPQHSLQPDDCQQALVQENLNTHKAASLHKAFPSAEARRIAERLEWQYTPKLGSWLTIPNANSGFSADNASPGASLIRQLWPPRSRRGKQLERRLLKMPLEIHVPRRQNQTLSLQRPSRLKCRTNIFLSIIQKSSTRIESNQQSRIRLCHGSSDLTCSVSPVADTALYLNATIVLTGCLRTPLPSSGVKIIKFDFIT